MNKWYMMHNGAVWVSKCAVICKNPHKPGEKYRIEFNFLNGGEKYSVAFDDKKTRDNHMRFFVRMMYQNYAPTLHEWIHWAIHAMCLCIITLFVLFQF